MASVGAGSPTALKGGDRFNKPAPKVFFRYFKRGRLRLMVVWRRVYEIVGFWQLLSVNPPLQSYVFYFR
jgi:hypothetical protein